MMKPFRYEHTRKLTRLEFAELHTLFLPRPKRWKLAALFVTGIACLLWSYTFLMGIVILVLASLLLVAPGLAKISSPRGFQEHRHLHQPLTFIVSNEGLQIQGATVDFKSSWKNLRVWEIRGKWLRLAPHGMQELYFETSKLEEAGVFGGVMELTRAHGVEYDSEEAK